MGSPQDRLDAFVNWFTANGGFISPSMELLYSPIEGIHLRVKPSPACPIYTGECVISCPHSLTLSALNALKVSPLSPQRGTTTAFPESLLKEARPQSVAAFCLALNWGQRDTSWWGAYLKCLPGPPDVEWDGTGVIDTPVWWGQDERPWIAGTNLEYGANALEALWKQEWERFGSTMIEWGNEREIAFTWHLYKWAMTILGSRAFSSSQLSHIQLTSGCPLLAKYDPDMLLYPGIDMLNHSPATLNSWKHNSQNFSIVMNDEGGPSMEVWNPYGGKNNGELLLSFGFCLDNNPHDSFALKLPPRPNPLLELIRSAQHDVDRSDKDDNPRDAGENCTTITNSHNRPTASDPVNNTYYVRSTSRFHLPEPGYPSSPWPAANNLNLTHLSGFPTSLLAHLAATLANTSEKHAITTSPSRFSPSTLHTQLGNRNSLAVTALLLARLRMELTRPLQTEPSPPAATKPATIQQRWRHATTYRQSQRKILTSNIAVLEAALLAAIAIISVPPSQPPPPQPPRQPHSQLLTLPAALSWLRSTLPKTHWHDFLAGLRAAVGVSVSVSDCAADSQFWRHAGLEEDVWTLWLSAVFGLLLLREKESICSPVESGAVEWVARDWVSAWWGVLGRRYGREVVWEGEGQEEGSGEAGESGENGEQGQSGEDEEIIAHVDELYDRIRRRLPGSELWAGAAAVKIRRLCVMVVKEESIRVAFSREGYVALRERERERGEERVWEEEGGEGGMEEEEEEEVVGLYVCFEEEH